MSLTLSSLPAQAQDAAQVTQVQLDTPGTVLEMREDWANRHTYYWQRGIVCGAPCSVELPLDSRYKYRVLGADMPASSPFSLPERDSVVLRVHPGNSALHGAGIALTIVGALAGFTGVLMALGRSPSQPAGCAGLITAGVGVGMMGAGIPMTLKNVTTVEFD
jgi:hypothetical protein